MIKPEKTQDHFVMSEYLGFALHKTRQDKIRAHTKTTQDKTRAEITKQ